MGSDGDDREAGEGPPEAPGSIPSDPAARQPGERFRLTTRTSIAFLDWSHGLADWSGLSLSDMIHQALIRWAEQSGYGPRPPRRLRTRRGLSHPNTERGYRRDVFLEGQMGQFKRLEADPEL